MQLPSPRKNFLNSINYFRGIAIFIIVLGHCYGLSRWEVSGKSEEIFYSISLNGSVYFVFISGFLYHYVFYHKFDFKKFMIKKAKYVLLPYLFFSTLPILYVVFIGDGGEFLPETLQGKPLFAVAWYFLTGRISYAYWYVPMAILLFAISPLINKIIKYEKVLVTASLLLLVSLIVHRPIDNINPFHSLIYFLPVYLIGIWSSINHDRMCKFLENRVSKASLLVIAIDLSLVQVLVFNTSGNFQKQFWSITVLDVNLLQKILLCIFFVSVLNKYEDTDITIAKKAAETSFAIYFIHPFLINALTSITYRLNFDYQGNIFLLILAALMVFSMSMAIALGFKTIFKKNSRYLIGW